MIPVAGAIFVHAGCVCVEIGIWPIMLICGHSVAFLKRTKWALFGANIAISVGVFSKNSVFVCSIVYCIKLYF